MAVEQREQDTAATDDSADRLSNLFNQESILERNIIGIDKQIDQNKSIHERLSKELKNADSLFDENKELHQETERLFNPESSATKADIDTHRQKIKTKLGDYQTQLDGLKTSQLDPSASHVNHAQTNFDATKLQMKMADARLDMFIMASLSHDIEPVAEKIMAAKTARGAGNEEQAQAHFSDARRMLVELGIIEDHSSDTLDEAALHEHCGHCELFDEGGQSLPSHERTKAASYMKVARHERLVLDKENRPCLIPSDMSLDKFKELDSEGKAQKYHDHANNRREQVPALKYKASLKKRILDNETENTTITNTKARYVRELVIVKEKVQAEQENLQQLLTAQKETLSTNTSYAELAQQQIRPAQATSPSATPTMKPGGKAMLEQVKDIVTGKGEPREKIKKIKALLPASAADKVGQQFDQLLFNQLGQDPDVFRTGVANILQQNGNLLNISKEMEGYYPEIKGKTGPARLQANADAEEAGIKAGEQPMSHTSQSPFKTTPKPP